MKNVGFAFFLSAIVVFPGEVFSSLERLRTFFNENLTKCLIDIILCIRYLFGKVIQMKEYVVKKAEKPFDICVSVPGSKSITNRALLMAAMGEGETVLHGVQFSEDSNFFLKALEDMGFEVNADKVYNIVKIRGMSGDIPYREAYIYVGSAGTAARFLTAFAAMNEGTYTLEASDQMKKRPMKELLEVLEKLGAKFEWLGEEYSFPMKVRGVKRQHKDEVVALNIDRSSQFLSALLMTAPIAFNSVTINLTGKRDARSYVEMTEQMMKQFGHQGVERLGADCYKVCRGSYNASDYQIEPDVSAACYFYAMAAVMGGSAKVNHIAKNSLQGDMKFIDILVNMGCRAEWTDTGLKLYAPNDGILKGIDVNMADFSDQTLTLAAIAPFADSPVTIHGVAHIRGQESDRVKVIVTELGRMGIKCDELEDGVVIYPGLPKPAKIETYNDHRVAMSFAVTGIVTGGIKIDNPMCCSKTFAGYFDILDNLY